ncbi:hypothetical protein FYJ26_04640 [Anaerococcus sp. WCA-380-WT-2B]|uniref:Uncharacterized protein n=1 Tax=Anaerococcus porci TaxID=2652269 RepID=A0A6N7VS82_9FIRM|nr:hypothetical protein [Anaerococcus porci]MSS77702.1 hypothetical protein [Anaerococcus porci]
MKSIKKVVAVSALALALNFTSLTSKADNINTIVSTTSNGIYGCSFTFSNRDILDKIKDVKINGESYEKRDEQIELKDKEGYSINQVDPQLFISKLKKGDKLEIITSDNKKISLNIEDPNRFMGLIFAKDSLKEEKLSDEKKENKIDEKKEEVKKENNTDSIVKSYNEDVSDGYIELMDNSLIGKIDSIKIRGKVLEKASSKLVIFNRDAYAISDNKIYINRLANNDIVSIKIADKDYNYVYNKSNNSLNITDKTQRIYKVKLVGSFEPAVIGQKKYDGVSAATGTATNSKNSNVKILVSDKENPTDEDYKELNEFRDLKVKNIILNEKSGMKGKYDSYNSAIILNGDPKEKGIYPISVQLVDNMGNEITTNSLDFKIYRTDEYLSDFIKEENFKKTKDGKFMWDMSPWLITRFDKDKEVVEVPKDLKAWFGSHESGKLGELGYLNKEKTQTLIVGKGRNLTIQNMKVLSSVNIIVKDGGILNVRDSSIFGKITVENGGRLSVNYDPYNKEFLNGASINGQIELKKGGILENSLIYSNTNFLTDSNKANKNVKPVVLVSGDSKIVGEVYVRGDEAPTGKDPETKRVYTGQNALKIENAKLSIEKDSTLGLYGAGRMATTSIGGDALILNNGKVDGEGRLIAIGGSGHSYEGGAAVSGKGEISNKEAYLKAGNTYASDAKKAKAFDSENIKLSKQTVGYAKDSEYKKLQNDDDQPGYWLNSQQSPKNEKLPNYDKEKFVYNDLEIEREKEKSQETNSNKIEEKDSKIDKNEAKPLDKKQTDYNKQKEETKPITNEEDKKDSKKDSDKKTDVDEIKDDNLDKKIKALSNENEKLQKDIENLNSQSQYLEKEIEVSNKEKDEATLEKEKCEKELEKKESLLNDANNKLNEFKNQAINDKEKSEEEKEKLKENIRLLEEAKNKAEEDKKQALENLEKLKNENDAKLNASLEKEKVAKEKLEKVQSEKEILLDKVKKLEEEKSSVEKKMEGLKNSKNKKDKNKKDEGVQTDNKENTSYNSKSNGLENKEVKSSENKDEEFSKENVKKGEMVTNPNSQEGNSKVNGKTQVSNASESNNKSKEDKNSKTNNTEESSSEINDNSNNTDKKDKPELSPISNAKSDKNTHEKNKMDASKNKSKSSSSNVRTGIRSSLPALFIIIISSISLIISKKIK